MGRVLSAIRKIIWSSGDRLALARIIEILEAGRIRCSADKKQSFTLVVGLPPLRELEKLVANVRDEDICAADVPDNIVVENLDERWTRNPLMGMILLLRDLGVLRLRIQEFEEARNALNRDSERGAKVEDEFYDRTMFNRSPQAEFQPVNEGLAIPGLIDPMAVAKETGVFASDYDAGSIYARPMLEVGSILKAASRGHDPSIDLGTAVSYLQFRARLSMNRNGALDEIWRLAIRDFENMADDLDRVAIASVQGGEALSFSAGRT
jgi:hypothetical protein